MSITYSYTDKAAVAPVGVSQVRTFIGPVNLKIMMSGTEEAVAIIDNFPSGLTERNLFGACVAVTDIDEVTTSYIADAVHTDATTKDVYFSLGSQEWYYDVSEGRAKIVEE